MSPKPNILEYLKKNLIILDGGTGTILQSEGLPEGELPERLNISRPQLLQSIHKSYFDAGSNVVFTNTFGASILKFSSEELEKIICAAVENARIAERESKGKQPKWVALDIGPTGRMLKPHGDLEFEDAVKIFAETIKIGAKLDVDLIFIETMGDSYETKAALLAAKECSDLPVFVSNAYGADGKLLTGANPAAMVAMLEGMGADAIGVNCSLGPVAMRSIVEEYVKYASVPVILKPNAGLPVFSDGKTSYDLSPTDFAREMEPMINLGARVVGGCCGTTPEYIAELTKAASVISPKPISKKEISLVSSYTHALEIGGAPLLIGERINPTGKPKFKEALLRGDVDYILREGIAEEEAGAHILDVNVGLPGIDEVEFLTNAVTRLQSVIDLPLQIDTSNAHAMESALRLYNGKPLINSVNGKEESLQAILPLVKKYGGVVVALTLDENGIPKDAEGRVEIAKKIIRRAGEFGIDKKDIIFDPLAMAVSADKNAAMETLRAVRIITEELECHTSLGVSNISFGLPRRDLINASFFTSAMTNGLSAAIMNPYSVEMMNAYRAHLALMGYDANFEKYIAYATENTDTVAANSTDLTDLGGAIIKGLGSIAADITAKMLETRESLDIINGEIIPALDFVGCEYEEKRIFLPGLLMSAEAAGAAFEVIRSRSKSDCTDRKQRIILATVKGDIHDIGKNILKLILENYGYEIIDLGKDVPPEDVLCAAESQNASIIGLSALMTTTLPAMETTVRMLKERLPDSVVMVGGAVLTEEYAKKIGADFYGKDAMEAVRFVENVNKR